jgi:beta-lactamase superfamily II metal-dependent hydrolase
VQHALTLRRRVRTGVLVVCGLVVPAALAVATPRSAQAAVPDAPRCSTAGTWRQGELNIYWFDVEQGDAQLVVGPTGRTLLIDLGENYYNRTGTATNATKIAAAIRRICGIGSGPVHLDYVMASHHHLDHIGYAGNPNDETAYGQGLYQLLTPGGLRFTVGQLIDHDGGVWRDSNGDGDCEVGTSSAPSTEIEYHNAGTTSGTGRRFICWLYGPTAQPDRAHINGKVLRLTNAMTSWPTLDLGTGVSAKVVLANAKGVKQADGTMPVSGDHTAEATPPSENDYSIGVRIAYGPYAYATAGDSDGEYSASDFGYTYNDVEALLTAKMGKVNTLRANHHGSAHSSAHQYVTGLNPQTGVISCGSNTFGHPGNRVLGEFRAIGAEIFLTNKPCASSDSTGPINYAGTLNTNGDIWLATGNAGAAFDVTYDAGTRSYTTRTSIGTPADIRVNEFMMAPNASGTQEWVELYNPTTNSIDIGGYFIDDVAAGGGAPKAVPAGTTIAAGGRYVMSFASGFLNNTGTDSVRFLKVSGGVETVYDTYTYTLSSTQYDKVFHRLGDGGTWCGSISVNVTKGTANPASCP